VFLLKGIFQRNDNTKKKACKLFQIRSDVRTPTDALARRTIHIKVFCGCVERLSSSEGADAAKEPKDHQSFFCLMREHQQAQKEPMPRKNQTKKLIHA